MVVYLLIKKDRIKIIKKVDQNFKGLEDEGKDLKIYEENGVVDF